MNEQSSRSALRAQQSAQENVVTVSSWGELLDVLHENSWNDRIKRHRSHFLFRGHSLADYELSSGLSRNGGQQVMLEKHLLRNFVKYARSHLESPDDKPQNFWHWLALAQHHGLPTRLLDWTYSPLISAHFVCTNLEHMDRDGAVWMIDYHDAHRHLNNEFKKRLERQGAHVFTDEMLSEVVSSLDQVNEPQGKEQVLFFEPPSLSSRIINQYACFSVQIGECKSMNSWLTEHKNLWKKVIIPSHLKWEVRDKLDQSNITERVLFPGMDGMCKWLSRQYFPRGSLEADQQPPSRIEDVSG